MSLFVSWVIEVQKENKRIEEQNQSNSIESDNGKDYVDSSPIQSDTGKNKDIKMDKVVESKRASSMAKFAEKNGIDL